MRAHTRARESHQSIEKAANDFKPTLFFRLRNSGQSHNLRFFKSLTRFLRIETCVYRHYKTIINIYVYSRQFIAIDKRTVL
jgi:hypothetical protein